MFGRPLAPLFLVFCFSHSLVFSLSALQERVQISDTTVTGMYLAALGHVFPATSFVEEATDVVR